MKKLLFGLAAAAAMVACADDITSSNIVGFDTKPCEQGKFKIFGVQFEAVDGTMDINKIVTGLEGVEADEEETYLQTAPQIQVPNAKGTYDIYYYLTNGYYTDENGEDAFKPGWSDQGGVLAGDPECELDGQLIPGVAIWCKDAQNSGTFMQSGQVPTEGVEVTAPAMFALRANSFPTSFNLNDATAVQFSGLAEVEADEEETYLKTAPQIQVPNAKGTYDLYYYLQNGYYTDENGEDAFKPGWCDQGGVLVGDPECELSGDVPAGLGFWTKGVSKSFTINFLK